MPYMDGTFGARKIKKETDDGFLFYVAGSRIELETSGL